MPVHDTDLPRLMARLRQCLLLKGGEGGDQEVCMLEKELVQGRDPWRRSLLCASSAERIGLG